MSEGPSIEAFVRSEEAPRLPAPPATVGVIGWLRVNLFSSLFNSLLSVGFGALVVMIGWKIVNFAFVDAVWNGDTREACLGENVGACWPFVSEKFKQWIYGFFPIDQRWRVNIVFLLGLLALIPMLMPKVPHKTWNALFLFVIFPLITIILLTGGNINFAWSTYGRMFGIIMLSAVALPMASLGLEEGIARNRLGLILAGAALVLWLASFVISSPSVPLLGTTIGVLPAATFALAVTAGIYSILNAISGDGQAVASAIKGWAAIAAGILGTMLLLDVDFGLQPVETSQWGGLTVTLVVSVTGIVFSLPLGILLALGRRSKMPVVQLFSIAFIELWRGVPLITVLFMASNMLPLFLPEGVSFDKLLRALIGVALFTAAYMAEVVRSGLQAIPRGQYEGAMALGLSFWQMMNKIILPQALKISIPNIVGNFISLFKDTTLVSIIGLFDLLGIVQAGLRDAKWATPVTSATAYFALAIVYWIFCFGMSRYSIYTERRLHTGHRR